MDRLTSSTGSTLLRRRAVALLVVLIWSACLVVIKASQADAPPLFYGALRTWLGGLPLLAAAAYTGKVLPPSRSWGWIVALGVANTTLGLGGMFLSVRAAGAAIPGVLANSQALLVAPFAAVLFDEPLTRGRLVGLLLGVAGVALIVGGEGKAAGDVAGAALGLMSAAGIAAGNLVIRHLGSYVDALTATTWQYVLGGLPLLGLSLIVESADHVVWTSAFVAGLLFLGLVGSAAASWLWYRLVREGELIPLTGLTLLTPAFALVLAWLIYRESVSVPDLFGLAVVLVGVTWVGWPRPGPRHWVGPG